MPVSFLSEAERERFNSFPADLSTPDLIAFFTLSDNDLRHIPKTASAANRLGFALRLLEMLGKNYEEKHLQLNSGDLLALYSDGVTEAYDNFENEWGDERLLKCLRQILENSSQAIVGEVFNAIDDFAQTAPQHDDITLMIIKRNH